jgi:hypothetical protein
VFAFTARASGLLQINTSNLERVRRIKNRMVRLTTRVETLREVLEKFLDDDSDMKDLNLTAKVGPSCLLQHWEAAGRLKSCIVLPGSWGMGATCAAPRIPCWHVSFMCTALQRSAVCAQIAPFLSWQSFRLLILIICYGNMVQRQQLTNCGRSPACLQEEDRSDDNERQAAAAMPFDVPLPFTGETVHEVGAS